MFQNLLDEDEKEQKAIYDENILNK